MEIYYAVLSRFGVQAADRVYSAGSRYAIQFVDEEIKAAMRKRLELRGKKINLSYADALGYILSLRLRVKFLTGDRAFENLHNVEFLK